MIKRIKSKLWLTGICLIRSFEDWIVGKEFSQNIDDVLDGREYLNY